MPKDLEDEYQPLLVKEHKVGKRAKVCDGLQSAFTLENLKTLGLAALLSYCSCFF